MKIKNANFEQLETVLKQVNESYDNNVVFRQLEHDYTRRGYIKFRFKTVDIDGAGSRLSPSGRRINSASWDFHGDFYDAILELCPDAVIYSAGKKINASGGNWQDWTVNNWTGQTMSGL